MNGWIDIDRQTDKRTYRWSDPCNVDTE